MNSTMSSLNPHAASYIPLNKKEEEANHETVLFNSPSEGHTGTAQFYFEGGDASSDFSIHEIEALVIDNSLEKSGLQQKISNQAEVQYINEDSEIHLAYLSFMFPNISEHCLAHVHSANDGDLEASINMLYDLECFPVAASKSLPVSSDTTGDDDASELEVTGREK
ncbi:unnamed protein product [Prunus armeniaca]|uniref:CUE domain-containing protein n=1 Tax=Prunus armeniaca TaxID=36596 RepID=A0A6J5Y2V1_PRUAR|nr:unnamed protein product [Prunus armeniaca]